MMSSGKLNIIILSDGKPGHVSQSRGIAGLIERDKKIREIQIKLDIGADESMLRGLTGFNSLINIPTATNLWKRAMRFIQADDIQFLQNNKPDVVISAGSVPATFNVIFKKHFKCANVVAMRPSMLPLSAFDLVILPMHDIKGGEGDNVISIYTSPNTCLPENIEQEGHDFAYHNGINRNYDLWALFIGGPSKVRDFPSDKVMPIVESILESARDSNSRLLISTSRRTETECENLLKDLQKKYESATAFLQIYSENPISTMRPILALSNRVFITEDSVSMVSEALWANRRVAVIELPAKTGDSNDKISRFKSHLIEKGLISNIENVSDVQSYIEKTSNSGDWSGFDDVEKARNAVNALISHNV